MVGGAVTPPPPFTHTHIQTKAVKDGDHYVLTGNKMWITNAGEAEIFLVFANVDFTKGYKGITCFVVEKSMGVQVGRKENKVQLAP
jgi:short-chain 2-methylacyl-CoA dehydrogenase